MMSLQQSCLPEDIGKAEEEADHIVRVYNKLNQMLFEDIDISKIQEDALPLLEHIHSPVWFRKTFTQLSEVLFQNGPRFDQNSLEVFLKTPGDIVFELYYGRMNNGWEGQSAIVAVLFNLCPSKRAWIYK